MTQETNLKSILEAVLLAAGEPLSLDRLQSIFGEDDTQPRPSKPEIRQALEALSEEYQTENRSLVLKEVASGYCLQISQQFAPWVNQLWQEKPPRYSRAVMETLAIIAYRQPVTRAEIEDIRGVAVSSNVVKTLLEREWIHIIGERETPGRPSLYATTHQFLDYFNLKSLEELPTLMQLQAFAVEGAEEEINEAAAEIKNSDASASPDAETEESLLVVETDAETTDENDEELLGEELEERIEEFLDEQESLDEQEPSEDQDVQEQKHVH